MTACTHKNFGSTQRGTYCLDCGMRMISEPPPIRYVEAMTDSRKLNWHAVSRAGYLVDLSKVYIGARYNADEGIWQLGRVMFCEECMQWEMASDLGPDYRSHEAADITHYAEDLLGTPQMPRGLVRACPSSAG